jgi:hypothetical protein
MSAMTTALAEFVDNGNSRTYVQSGHTAIKPQLVIQKRKGTDGNSTVLEDTIMVVDATEDADAAILPSKILFSVTVKRPISGIAADLTAALATFRDVVAGDEFTTMVNTQKWVSS